ncbi:MAG: complex I subunit 5 family protein [Nitriliruptoraceae bacterium]
MSTLLWVVPILWPLLAAGLVVVAAHSGAARLVPGLVASGPVPALLLALVGPPGPPPSLSWLLLGLQLDLDPAARLLLATTSLVWLAAGIAARALVTARWSTAGLWLLTLAGNVGLLLAGDLVSLYTLYAVMTFAAYGLVVHDRSPAARRAGRIYLVMAVLGEALLISGLMLAAGVAGSIDTATVAAALGDAATGRRDLVVGLVTAGFAVKAGVVPLHVWLPLAHPAAPVPASAVLSGAMIKAGLVGWLAVLPLGAVSAPGWSAVLIGVGLVTVFAAAAIGVVQDRPKVVLAYSSISQMGLITVLVGVGLVAPGAAPLAIAAAATYALHHGVAKGALFLGVGLRAAWAGPRGRQVVLAGTVLAGGSLAGAPLTSGWVAKAAMKDAVAALAPVWADRVTALLALAAVATTLLMARLLVLLARPTAAEEAIATAGAAARRDPGPAGTTGLGVGWGLLLLATLGATWLLPVRWLAPLSSPRIYLAGIVDATWPVGVGALLAVGAMVLRRRFGTGEAMAPGIPAGDLVVLAEAAARPVARLAGRIVGATTRIGGRLGTLVGGVEARVRPGEGLARLDVLLRRWQIAGLLFVLVLGALLLALGIGPVGR